MKPYITPHPVTLEIAARFTEVALTNVVREYPNHLSHALTGPEDARTPRQLHPLFYGSFDWHSCVHNYWLLARLYRTVPDLPHKKEIAHQFNAAFTIENIAGEIDYFQRPAAKTFERPYGWAWLLMLCHELSLQESKPALQWHSTLLPLATFLAARFTDYLTTADYPIRAGAHGNSAFAAILAAEYARSHHHPALSSLLQSKARQWYQQDVVEQAWEPSQSDFLSPLLTEALCMQRLLPPDEFQPWFKRFMPNLHERQPTTLFTPAQVSDRTDPQIAHLDGLNLSRAWCFHHLAQSLKDTDPRTLPLQHAATEHMNASLPHITKDYAGSHWLPTFALLALCA